MTDPRTSWDPPPPLCCEPPMPPTTSHICPLCHSAASPQGNETGNSTLQQYETLPNPTQFRCTSCGFISDSRLLDAVGLITTGTRYEITSSYDKIAGDPSIELMPWSSIRERLRSLDPDPLLVTLNWPDNPTTYGGSRWACRHQPANTWGTSGFDLVSLALPLFLGTSLDDLRRLSRRLGPLQIPETLHAQIPKEGDELFLLKSPPANCIYPVVTCNPRAAKAKASLTRNRLTRARQKADAYPLPAPTSYLPVLELLPFEPARTLRSQLTSSELTANATSVKHLVSAVHRARDTACTQTLSYLCLLLHDTRRPPAAIPIPTSFTYNPKSTHHRGSRQLTISWSHAHYHSPCTRWWKKNPAIAARLHELLGPLFDPLRFDLWEKWEDAIDTRNATWDDSYKEMRAARRKASGAEMLLLEQRIAECGLSKDTLLWLFRRLRIHAGIPTLPPPSTPSPYPDHNRAPLNVKGPIASPSSESTAHV